MKSFYFILFFFVLFHNGIYAQMSVVNKKGTVIFVDSSKWVLTGADIYNKNTGNVGIGNTAPSYKLDVTGKLRVSDSLVVSTARVNTLNSGVSSDSIVTVDANGILKKRSYSNILLTNNGISENGDTTQLGGTLNKATTIATSATNTLSLSGLQSGVATDSIITLNPSTNVLRRVSPNVIIREPWNIVGGTNPATSNTDNVYITGNVSIGKSTNAAQLDVKGRINADSTIAAPNYTSTIQSTASGSTFTWNLNSGANAVWNLSAGANTLTITNAKAGMYGLIRLVNSGTSTLTFASGASANKVINGGGGTVLLTQTASAVDILTFFYDGSIFWWTVGNNYN